jgi:YggT family protein
MAIVITTINSTISLLSLIIFVYSLLSFFLSPFHPIRQTLARFIEPIFAPIRRVVPPVGGFDLSPLIFIILLQVIGALLTTLLRSF